MDTPRIHINHPTGIYVSQVHRRGARMWESVGKHKSAKAAAVRAVSAMTDHHNRARVIFCAEWYDPTLVMEIRKE
jgi:hypothetical protein